MRPFPAVNYKLTPEAVSYCWRQLAMRMGLQIDDLLGDGFESLGISIQYGNPDEINLTKPGVVVYSANALRWIDLVNCEPGTIEWVRIESLLPPSHSSVLNGSLPVLFFGGDVQPPPLIYSTKNNVIVFNVDIIATVFFMLTRWEETYLDDKDNYERFPGTSSLAYKQGFLDRPIVDEYALILKSWISQVFPKAKYKTSSFSVKLSHDIDYVYKYSSWRKKIRYLVRDIFINRDLSHATKSLGAIINSRKDPYYQGIIRLAGLSHFYGLKSAFYFMTANPSPWESGYWNSTKSAGEIIRFLILDGHEVGLHPGHQTLNNLDLLREEKKRLSDIVGKYQFGGRQHNLRFKVPDTWRNWEAAGLKYDATMAYADYMGFRCGTCFRYRPFDIEQNREINVEEEPLIVMDVTLKKYVQLAPNQGKEVILELAKQCKKVGGVFTLLWHNSSFGGDWTQWDGVYQEVLSDLAQMQNI